VHKSGKNQVGWVDIGGKYGTQNVVLANGQNLTVFPLLNATSQRLFQVTNGPGFFNRYNGVVFTLQKRLSNRWQANFAYTYGRGDGLVNGNANSTTSGQDPNAYINANGELQYDRPHIITVVSSYQIPKFDANVSASVMAVSGLAYAPQALVQLPQGRLSINIAAPGDDYRFPFQKLLWLRFNKSLFRHGTRRIDLGAELDNTLQNTAFDGVATQNFFASNFAQPITWTLPRRLNFNFNVYW
jgi:hypothetical protein